jgi:hypothetical protein
MTDEDVCQTCMKSHTGTWRPRHPFNDGSLSGMSALKKPDKKKEEGKSSNPPWPFDPVLRQALVDKGVVTPDDLRDAEAKIRAVTGQFEQEIARD